jgi:hypothetical protein
MAPHEQPFQHREEGGGLYTRTGELHLYQSFQKLSFSMCFPSVGGVGGHVMRGGTIPRGVFFCGYWYKGLMVSEYSYNLIHLVKVYST